MPMMSMSVAGGTTNFFRDRDDFINKCNAYRGMMEEVGRFVISEYVPLTLALSMLYPEWDNVHNGGEGYGAGVGNFLAWGGFPQANDSMAIKGGWKLKGGSVNDLLTGKGNLAAAKAAVEANLEEFITRSRYSDPLGEFGTDNKAYPGDVTRTVPERDMPEKYSWLKAPRFGGNPMEVGPLARMVINGLYPDNGDPIVAGPYAALYTSGGHLDTTVINGDLVSGLAGTLGATAVADVEAHIVGLKGGLSTMDRLRARAIESFHMVTFLIGSPSKGANSDAITFSGGWIDQLKALWPVGQATAPKFFRETIPSTDTVHGYGLVEAPRGALGHFITATGGKINAYQCVVPTTWNASPKDGAGNANHDNTSATKRGPMEQALIDVPFVDPGIPANVGGRDVLSGVEVLRVAQSFDPCIACAVH
jgi:Ni,Fe-hydrogenase I large subunit